MNTKELIRKSIERLHQARERKMRGVKKAADRVNEIRQGQSGESTPNA